MPSFNKNKISEDAVSVGEILRLLWKRKLIFLVTFLLAGTAVYFQYLKVSKNSYHIQQNVFVRNDIRPMDMVELAYYRTRFTSNLPLADSIIASLSPTDLTAEKLIRKNLSIKTRMLGGKITESGEQSEEVLLTFNVRHQDENIAKKILSVWIPLCLAEVERENKILQNLIATNKEKATKMEKFHKDVVSAFFPDVPFEDSIDGFEEQYQNQQHTLDILARIGNSNSEINPQDLKQLVLIGTLQNLLTKSSEIPKGLKNLHAQMINLKKDKERIEARVLSFTTNNTQEVLLTQNDISGLYVILFLTLSFLTAFFVALLAEFFLTRVRK